MEITSSPRSSIHHQEKDLINSKNSISSSSSSSPTPPHTPKVPQETNNPYPTTFVQADTSNFKHVVQLLTGSSSSSSSSKSTTNNTSLIPPLKSTPQKKHGYKLYERRNSLKNGLMIDTLVPKESPLGYSPRRELLSPSILDFPSLVLSPITPPLIGEKNSMSCDGKSLSEASTPLPWLEEEKAIAEKKFYFHSPSPRSTTNNVEPQLLPLFPLTSPRVTGSSSSSSS